MEDWSVKDGSHIVSSGKAMKLVSKYLQDGSTILDIGSGNGLFAKQSLKYSFLCTDTANFTGSDIAFKVLDANKSWDIEGVFDAVTAWNVIEHIENPSLFAREAHTRLRIGGLLFISVPCIWDFWSRVRFLLKGSFDRYNPNNSHLTILNPEVMSKIFKDFSLLASGVKGNTAFFVYKKLNNLKK